MKKTIRYKIRKTIGKLLRNILLAPDCILARAYPYKDCPVKYEGQSLTIRCFRGDFMSLVYRKGKFYEVDALNYIYKRYGVGGVYVDLGAFIGNHSLFFGKVCKADAVISVEPFNKSFQLLTYNLSFNGIANAYAHNVATGGTFGHCSTNIEDRNNLGMNTIAIVDSVDKNNVEIVTADSLIDSPPKLIKIDTEGFLLPTLKGLRQTIEKHHPILMLEIWPEPLDAVIEFLQTYDYTLKAQFNATPTYIFE